MIKFIRKILNAFLKKSIKQKDELIGKDNPIMIDDEGRFYVEKGFSKAYIIQTLSSGHFEITYEAWVYDQDSIYYLEF